jgi:glutamate N-acetyltransferase/amino-acid N-acetyltransferase
VRNPKLISGGVTAPKGFLAGGISCGIKKTGAPDLAVIFSEEPAAAAAVFTRNLVKAAPVTYTREVVQNGVLQAVVINSGNANAVTGERGYEDAVAMARTTAESLHVIPQHVAVASTGTIGILLPIDKIEDGIRKLTGSLNRAGGDAAARAIMTTDTVPKSIAVRVPLSSGTITLGGMAKGAGMICPDMATLLAFLTTDAAIEGPSLSRALREVVDTTFNSITVDGDSSTNDTVLILANGASGTSSIDADSTDYGRFRDALEYVCAELARMLVRDGEGATKLIEVRVAGAKQKEAARTIAKTIANSLLVKTAIFGCDANWGRIMAAAGRAGVEFDPRRVEIRLDDVVMLKQGAPVAFDEDRAKEILGKDEVRIVMDLHEGSESAIFLTCDLSYDYVKINASYRT